MKKNILKTEDKTSKHYTITFNKEQDQKLKEVMNKYNQDRPSSVINMLIGNDLNRKSAGRPISSEKTQEEKDLEFILNKPDFTNDTPKSVFYNGKYCGKKELAWEDERARRVPKNLTSN